MVKVCTQQAHRRSRENYTVPSLSDCGLDRRWPTDSPGRDQATSSRPTISRFTLHPACQLACELVQWQRRPETGVRWYNIRAGSSCMILRDVSATLAYACSISQSCTGPGNRSNVIAPCKRSGISPLAARLALAHTRISIESKEQYCEQSESRYLSLWAFCHLPCNSRR